MLRAEGSGLLLAATAELGLHLTERGSDGAMWTHTPHPSGSGSGHDGFTSVVSNGTVLAAVPQHDDEGALEPSYRLQVDGAWLSAAQVS